MNVKRFFAGLAIGLGLTGVVFASSPYFGTSIQGNITSLIPGTGASNLGKAEDAAHTSSDVGVQALARYNATMAQSAGTDGDYATLNEDSNGRLRVVNQLKAGDGATPKSDLGATNTGTTPLTAAAVLVGGVQACNGDSGTNVVKLYDKASAATSADTPFARIVVAAGACDTYQAGPTGLKLTNGLSIRATTEKTDNGVTGAAANTVTVNFSYI